MFEPVGKQYRFVPRRAVQRARPGVFQARLSWVDAHGVLWREARQKGRGEFFFGNKGGGIRDLTGFGCRFCSGGGFADGRSFWGDGAIGNLSGQEFFSGNKGDRSRDLTGFEYWLCGGGGLADGRSFWGNGAIGNLSGLVCRLGCQGTRAGPARVQLGLLWRAGRWFFQGLEVVVLCDWFVGIF